MHLYRIFVPIRICISQKEEISKQEAKLRSLLEKQQHTTNTLTALTEKHRQLQVNFAAAHRCRSTCFVPEQGRIKPAGAHGMASKHARRHLYTYKQLFI